MTRPNRSAILPSDSPEVKDVMRYTVILEHEEDGGYHAFVPALKGCHSHGSNGEEAFQNVAEAIELYIDSLREHGEPVPVEDILIRHLELRYY
jgi:predicted RNase H-like HicB family nuclease